MMQISPVDQVLMLLRQQLQRSDTAKTSRSGKRSATAAPLDRARALAAMDELGEERTRRAVLRGLLADRLGDAVSNDPGFDEMIDRVDDMIRSTPEGHELLVRAVEQLRRG